MKTIKLTVRRQTVLLAVAAGTVFVGPLDTSYNTAEGNRNVSRETGWLWHADLIQRHPKHNRWLLTDEGQDLIATGVR